VNEESRLRSNLYSSYSGESSRGLFGIILSLGHRLLESSTPHTISSQLKILEVGGGRNPHFTWIKDKSSIESYFIEDLDFETYPTQSFEVSKHQPKGWRDSKNYDGYFDRIIACHVLEHLQNPELHLENWISLVKKGGTISILLPNDPGLIWGAARIFYRRKLKRNGWIDLLEYDYALALEHVNSIQNLMRICAFKAVGNKITIKHWPLKVPFIFFNMQTVIHIQKL